MAVQVIHAFTRWTYERTPEGRVLVNDLDGNHGLFTPDGRWISGDITAADTQVIGFVAGPHALRDPDRPDPGTRLAAPQD